LTLGMIGSSHKENEKRVAIHPVHFPLIDRNARKRVFVEKDYGARFRISDSEIEQSVAGTRTREEIFAECDIVMIFKPTFADFLFFRPNQIIWGALHLVQTPAFVQEAIDKKLTCIAMESMYTWRPDGKRGVWLFHTQSELAGYCSVLHSLQLAGMKGWHDQPKRVAVISFGSTGRGAVHAFMRMDFTDITVFTQREALAVAGMIPTVKYDQYHRDANNPEKVVYETKSGQRVPFGVILSGFDIVVNCVYQDTDNPLMFIYNRDLCKFKCGSKLIDVSCDHGMGFEFAHPTTFDDPTFEVGNGVTYYAVDHSPSYLYNTASLEHSKEAYPYVGHVLGGEPAWRDCLTVDRAVEIRKGVVENSKILSYQNRERDFPHRVIAKASQAKV
ncbi:MAG: alanine dehydrogenase, partial [bacterium]